MFGDTNIMEVDTETYRKNLSLVAQESTLYEGTIRQNVALSVEEDEATDAAIEEACKSAQIHDFITSLPDGTYSPLRSLHDLAPSLCSTQPSVLLPLGPQTLPLANQPLPTHRLRHGHRPTRRRPLRRPAPAPRARTRPPPPSTTTAPRRVDEQSRLREREAGAGGD
jgi:hypothetical protein